MKKVLISIISFALIISMLLCATVPAFAAGTEEEAYISELRLIYAEDYDEAKQILADSEFSNYKLLKENLNKDSDEIGVWLAYKTTTDIEDAITDLAVMQMGGGYNEGNYEQMIKESYDEYVAMGEIYLEAIEYFIDAYDAGDFLAKSAYRQLNFYTVETQEDVRIEIPYFEGELLGDIFYDGIDAHELATMFFEGNSYALTNIRSLIAMGVSYNEDGKTYLKKVGEAAAAMNKDANAFDDEDYDDLAETVALAVSGLRDVLDDLAEREPNLNYADESFTEEEIRYMGIKAIADMMRDIKYLNGKTLYDFFMTYDYAKDGKTALYPLIAALNEGQTAMVKVGHYYDVIRYSVMTVHEGFINSEIAALEEIYAENPFNIYTGVDRTIYKGTFALTTAADRADAYSEISLMDEFLGTEGRRNAVEMSIATGALGLVSLGISAFSRHLDNIRFDSLREYVYSTLDDAANGVGKITEHGMTYADRIDLYFDQYYFAENPANYTFTQKVNMLQNYNIGDPDVTSYLDRVSNEITAAKQDATSVLPSSAPVSFTTGMFFVLGGALMIYSAYNILSTVYHYYNPKYDDIPIAMVDLVETVDGDRYIKYDVVYEAETRDDGNYSAGDLNAFEAKRWNALYYTKSYEAGKPLLADEFVVSHTSNQPKDGYTPVHLFGETVCFDLNKYNFEGDTGIYLSVKQSKNDKSAVADVPEVVGSMFGAGFLFLAGGIGAALGIGGTVVTQAVIKKKKSKVNADVKAEAETSN